MELDKPWRLPRLDAEDSVTKTRLFFARGPVQGFTYSERRFFFPGRHNGGLSRCLTPGSDCNPGWGLVVMLGLAVDPIGFLAAATKHYAVDTERFTFQTFYGLELVPSLLVQSISLLGSEKEFAERNVLIA